MSGERGWQKTIWVLLFLLPSMGGLIVFTVIPILSSLGLTLFKWDLVTPPVYIGLDNFQELFADPEFWAALRHTLGFIAGYLPMVMILGLAVAVALNQKFRGTTVFRTLFYLPVVSSWVAVALLWMWIFNPRFGMINYGLELLGITGPTWLFDPNWAMPAIIITSVWKDTGFVMVMFLAGLQAIPATYYEAASIDGANSRERFFRITLPLLSPTTFFAIVISLINSFQLFDQVWVMTGGGPAGATSVLVEQIVNNAFRYSRMGYASALSWVLFALVFVITVFQLRIQQKWVTYD
jgi:multiple sugar transport system permease protein